MPTSRHLLIAALALVLLPFVLAAIGLGVTSATEVVIFALACMALNILVGYTGLTSFGHGAWFGLAAYAAGLSQRLLFEGSFFLPLAFGLGVVFVLALAFGFLILRRRGVYFSLLTLALAAMLYSVAFRWTEVTGGENGLGGITRPQLAGVSFDSAGAYYALVAGGVFRRRAGAVALPPLAAGQRAGGDPRKRTARPFHRLPDESRQAHRLRRLGHAHRPGRHAARVQQPHDVGRTDLGGVFGRTARDGHHRRHALVPRPGARRAVLRDLSRLAVAHHRKLAALLWRAVRRLHRVLAHRSGRPVRARHGALAQECGGRRRDGRAPGWHGGLAGVPATPPRPRRHGARSHWPVQAVRWHSCGQGCVAEIARPHAARADRPERRRQDNRVQPDLGPVHARPRQRHARWPKPGRAHAGSHHAGRHRPFVPDHQPVRRAVGRRKRAPGRAGARCAALRGLGVDGLAARREPRRRRSGAHDGPGRCRKRASGARSRTAGSACSTWRSHSPRARARCCSTNRSPAWQRPSASASAS